MVADSLAETPAPEIPNWSAGQSVPTTPTAEAAPPPESPRTPEIVPAPETAPMIDVAPAIDVTPSAATSEPTAFPLDADLRLDADPGPPPPPPSSTPDAEPGANAVDQALNTMRDGVREPIVRQPADGGPNADLEVLTAEDAAMGMPAEDNFFLPSIGDMDWFQMEGLKFRIGPIHARVSLGLSAEYNSNIFARSTNVEADYVGTFAPSITLGTGGWRGEATNFARLTYTPSFVFYANNSDNDTVNQAFSFLANLEFSRYTTDFALNFSRSNQPNATQSGLTEYSTLGVTWDNSYFLGSKFFVRGNLAYLLQDYANSDDYTTYTFTPQIAYQFSPRITMFAGPFAGISFVGDGNQPFQGVSVGVTYDTLAKLSGEFVAGVQARQFDGGNLAGAKDFITPIFSFNLNYDLREETQLSLGLSRDVQISDLLRGLTYVNNEASLVLKQKIIGRLNFQLAVSYQLLQYEGDGPDGRDDQYFVASPSLSYTFWRDQLTWSIYYRRQQLVSDVSTVEYDLNALGTGISFQF